ncbi:MAG: peroxiredoxin [Myxococcales bacterium FL481]|nr:MAG: peroxiredoxin [Myxococcales bacterium FL481]
MRHRLVSLALIVAVPVGFPAVACGPTERPDGGVGLLAVGAPVPRLRTNSHLGRPVSIGGPDDPVSLVYFYPKDATPGCTREACAFRDVWDQFEQHGVRVIGVSGDDDASHRSFAADHRLPFPLVADTSGAWAAAFGVPTTAGMPKRVSFLVDRKGRVASVYADVDPGVHAREVLADVAALPRRAMPPSPTRP